MIYWCIIDWLLRENIVVFLAEIAEVFLTVVPTITSHSCILFYGTFKGKCKTWNSCGDHSPSKSEVQFLNLLWTIVWLIFKSYKNNRHQYPCSSFLYIFTKRRNNYTSSIRIFPFFYFVNKRSVTLSSSAGPPQSHSGVIEGNVVLIKVMVVSQITLLTAVASYERFLSLLWQWISEQLDLLEREAETINTWSKNTHRPNAQGTNDTLKLFY